MSRAGWGAAAPRWPASPRGPLVAVVLHHTDMPTAGLAPDRAAEASHVRAIQRAHFDREFADIGYHFVVVPSGRIYLGRPLWALGAHVAGHNSGTVGVAVAGDFDVEHPSEAALAAVGAVLRHLIPGAARVPLVGHRDLAPKNCPGEHLYPYVKVLGERASQPAWSSRAAL